MGACPAGKRFLYLLERENLQYSSGEAKDVPGVAFYRKPDSGSGKLGKDGLHVPRYSQRRAGRGCAEVRESHACGERKTDWDESEPQRHKGHKDRITNIQ